MLIRELLALQAHSASWHLTVLANLADGVNMLSREPFDIVLLDLTLPDSSGLATLDQIRNAKHDVPIVVLTGLDAEFGIEAVRRGAQDYISKNELTDRLLTRTLQYAIERHQFEHNMRVQSAALNASADAIVITDRDGCIEWGNPAVTDLTGYEIEELIGQNPRIFKSGLQSAEFYQEMWATILSGESWNGEMVNKHKDGSLYVEEMSVTPLCNWQGEIDKFIAIKRDVTERKKTSDQLMLLNRVISLTSSTLDHTKVLQIICHELATQLDVPQVAATLIDDDGVFAEVVAEFVSQDTKPSLGWKIPLVDNPSYQLLIQHKIPLVFNDVFADDQLHPVEKILRERGTRSMLLAPILTQGEVIGSIGCDSLKPREFTTDEQTLVANVVHAASRALENSLLHQRVREQNTQLNDIVKERTVSLQRTNERLATILNNASDSIILLDAALHIQDINKAFENTFHYERDELINQSVMMLTVADMREQLLNFFNSIRDQKSSNRFEISVQRKSGDTFVADIGVGCVPDNEGHIVCSIRDISHLKEVEQIKDQFVSMVSHELRTPISSILLASNMVTKYYDRLTDDQKRNKVTQISDQAKRLTDLVSAILDVARLDAQHSNSRTSDQMVDVAAALREVVKQLTDEVNVKQQQMDVFIHNSQFITVGEHTDIIRIWQNLLSNAVKYTDTGGGITVELFGGCTNEDACRQKPDLKRFQKLIPTDFNPSHSIMGIVTDNGHGIPPEDLDKLFTRFFRGAASSTNIPGTGLGLSLVRDTLHSYGGNIVVDSQYGEGTSFCFWIPIVDKEE